MDISRYSFEYQDAINIVIIGERELEEEDGSIYISPRWMRNKLIGWINDRKVYAFEFLHDAFQIRNYRVGSQDRKSGFLRREMYALLSTCRSVKSVVPVTNVEHSEIYAKRV